MKISELVTDQQIAVMAILLICLMSVAAGLDGSKDLLLALGGAIAGWMSKTEKP